MPNPHNKTIVLCDATTGSDVRVIVTGSGKLYAVEGLSDEMIKKAREAVARITTHANGESVTCPKK
jgi:hypothetical protein